VAEAAVLHLDWVDCGVQEALLMDLVVYLVHMKVAWAAEEVVVK
tara:strand:- start:153 stop:284 length:132 start_codon:yes stop_codon:yes gene_type:complete